MLLYAMAYVRLSEKKLNPIPSVLVSFLIKTPTQSEVIYAAGYVVELQIELSEGRSISDK